MEKTKTPDRVPTRPLVGEVPCDDCDYEDEASFTSGRVPHRSFDAKTG